MASHQPVPRTRVISPSPTPSESSGKDNYFGPVTRSIARASRKVASPAPIEEDGSSSDPENRSRARSRSPGLPGGRRRHLSGLTGISSTTVNAAQKRPELTVPNGSASNGHLSPASASKSYWRELSRSPSPLGLIPIHQEWRSFIHRHEIPRKVLHTSIGFLTLGLYIQGIQPSSIHPILLGLLIPISLIDFLRHQFASLNKLYIRLLGALMRESEVDGYNGVIWYLLGTWAVLRFAPKDVAVMSVLLLSWCDTAASTFGRLWGRYTPRIRRGKSLAGSIAALLTGVATSMLFYGWVAPSMPASFDEGVNSFAYTGTLRLPHISVTNLVGWHQDGEGVVEGPLALAAMSLWAGVVASVSEAVDLWGLDDNVTIPLLCGVGLWAFLKAFGSA